MLSFPTARFPHGWRSASAFILLSVALARGQQQAGPGGREFAPGVLTRIEDLPAGRLRTRIQGLPETSRQQALDRLRRFHFTELDVQSLEADGDGGIFYADHFSLEPAAIEAGPFMPAAAVAVDPFPAALLFHSKPGAPNVLYLNFSGEKVTGTAWNTSLGRTEIPAVAFSTDSDFATFNDAEQLAIKRVWQRVAEDFAPFDIDVTTERPASFGTRTAHALITRNTDANGAPNPSSTAGGVAYISVFGESGYSKRRPAWIFYNNLGNSDSVIAGAISHEIGHNLGLSHDGATNGTEYYRGHGSGDISWSPIMGSSSTRNVTQWSKGEYYQANNTEDDLAIIAARISYRTDDHGDTAATARPLVISGGTNIVSTTPELDPGNASPANKGILERNTDVDVFSFTTGNGPAKLMVNPWITPTGARGGNLDLLIELRDANGSTVATNNPGDQTTAQIQKTLAPGTYYLWVRNSGAGAPLNPVPTGYTAYGSIGQYFISGFIAPSIGSPAVRLTATANNSSWGTVSPTNATYAPGTSVQVIATPANYYRFERWTNSVNGTNNPLTFVLNTNVVLQAVFAAKLTTNHPTPYWWLASYGYLGFENAVNATGANGFPLWQSYLAGLNPNDPNNQLKLSLSEGVSGAPNVLNWNTVTGRVYTLWFSTNLAAGFSRVPAASNLPATTRSFTQTLTPAPRAAFYRIEAIRP